MKNYSMVNRTGIVLLSCVLVTAALSDTDAATYYVAKNASNASDSNSGSSSQPWVSISHAVSRAVAGDLVMVKAGIYYESILIARSGSQGKPIEFRAAANESVIIDGSVNARDKFIEWKGSASGGSDKNYIIFDGFEIRKCRRWAFWIEGDHNTVRNCTIHDSGPSNKGVGVLIRQGDYNSIISNDVYNSGWNGINAENSNHTTIEYNRSHDNREHFGINVFPNTSDTQSMQTGNNIRFNILYNNKGGIYTRYQQDNRIEGNVIYNNSESGIFLHSHGNGPSTYRANTKIYHNTIIDNGFHGLWNVNATHLIVKNNIIAYHTVRDRYYEVFVNSGKTAGHIFDNNLYYPDVDKIVYWGGSKYSLSGFQSTLNQDKNGKAADPRFTSLSSDDYTITANSAAVDAGANLTTDGSVVDLTGTRRPVGSASDIGAYEFGTGTGTGTKTVPAAPKNLQIISAP